MRPGFPYHACDFIGCREMAPFGAPYCAAHLAVLHQQAAIRAGKHDIYFPDVPPTDQPQEKLKP